MSGHRIAVVGATGAVGREMWNQIEASDMAVDAIYPYTTERSAGTELDFRGQKISCRFLTEENLVPVDLVLASAGAETSRTWSPRFAAGGAIVIDNSSAFRRDPDCPLVVPELNRNLLTSSASIIANPNCSTIQMVLALAPLDREWGLKAVRVATYQSASGAGDAFQKTLHRDSRSILDGGQVPPRKDAPAFDVIPHIGSFDGGGESTEEAKLRDETRRLLGKEHLRVSATCVRVPVFRGHSEAVWASFESVPKPTKARELLIEAGILVQDDPERSIYPTARQVEGKHEVFVGRIRPDTVDSNGLCLWVVSDNLLKGAATNAIQIAEVLMEKGILAESTRA